MSPPSGFSVKRLLLSILLIGHLLAVVGPPLAYQARGPIGLSPSVATVMSPVESYGQALFLDRGYAFFAPDPTPSHLFQVAIKNDKGEVEQFLVPDRTQQKPRLAYHRHFMLSEYLTEIYQPPGPPRELAKQEPDVAEQWRKARDHYMQVRQSIYQHVEASNPGSEIIGLRRVEHLVPRWETYNLNPVPLDDKALYRIMFDQLPGESGGTLIAPQQPAETVPIPEGNREADET